MRTTKIFWQLREAKEQDKEASAITLAELRKELGEE